MRCGACRKAIRQDENLVTHYCDGAGGPGYYQACPRCVARSEGVDPPTPKRYPAEDIHDPRGLKFGICGLCRLALHYGEAESTIRITEPDIARVAEDDSTAAEYRPGVYRMCNACSSLWRPIVAQRWVKEGHISAVEYAPEPML